MEAGGAWNMTEPYIDTGLVLEPPDDMAVRRAAFWEWWLTDAIPAAWEASLRSSVHGSAG